MHKQQVIYEDLGQMEYKTAWEYQEKLLQENVKRKSAVYSQQSAAGNMASEIEETVNCELSTVNYLLFVEHPPVYTLGKSGNENNLLIDDQQLEARGVQYFKINRGGDITYHGPGQIVGYPILDLENFYTDIGKYLRNIEETIIRALATYGVQAGRSAGETGVWIDADIKGQARKICAIGVRTSRWITMHGFALNVNTDLSFFNNIIPCGIQDKQVTSIEKELGRTINFEEAKQRVRESFAQVFDVNLI